MPRSDLARALTLHARGHDEGELLAFLRDNAEQLAPLLETTPEQVRGLEVGHVTPLGRRVLTHLSQRRQQSRAPRIAEARRRAVAAAETLASSAELQPTRVVLRVEALLGSLVRGRQRRARLVPSVPTPTPRRSTAPKLAELARLRPFQILAAWLTARGLFVSWWGGRGRICLYPRPTTGIDPDTILRVVFPAPRSSEVLSLPKPRWLGWEEAFAGALAP
ncbi:MAG: hypothetical protein IPJ34_13425 [Myxococcales bacterium]|nr:hypothetical protein [Myxococcales bacterium]